jgi:undecaprenyl-diphosphatase
MDLWEAIILGIVEGLTEYLPVSSTGHLIVAQRMMGIEGSSEANAFAICIQAGAIAAVLGLYWKRMKQMARGLLGRDAAGRALARSIVVAFVPAAIFGYVLERWIEQHLFGLEPIIAAWLLGGLAILLVVWTRRQNLPPTGKSIEDLRWQAALIIGLIQCIAMWPGVSRSLVTIVGGVLVGLGLVAAVEFSFLLGLLTLTAATAYKAVQHGPLMLETYGLATIAVGFAAAMLSAIIAVQWMVAYLSRHGLAIFGYYRVAVALIVAVLLWTGRL